MGSMDAHHVGSDDGVGSGSRSRARATSMSGLERAYAADAADDDPAPISLLLVQEIPLVKLNSAQNLASFVTSLGATMEEEGALDRREMSPLQRRAAATRVDRVAGGPEALDEPKAHELHAAALHGDHHIRIRQRRRDARAGLRLRGERGAVHVRVEDAHGVAFCRKPARL